MENTQHSTGVATLISKLEFVSTSLSSSIDPTNWLIKLMITGSEFAGSLSSEIIPPLAELKTWTLIQRFSNAEALAKWKNSAERKNIVESIQGDLLKFNLKFSEEEIIENNTKSSAALAIVADVKPGMEKAYRAWKEKVHKTQAKFPGYRGSYLQSPTESSKTNWTTILHFDRPEDLDTWFKSDERKALIAEAQHIVKSHSYQNITSSFPGWFHADAHGKNLPRWKTALLVLLSLFPIASLLIKYFRPLMSSQPVILTNFVSNILSVTCLTWLLMPIAVRIFDFWLYPRDGESLLVDLKGLALIICLYVAEMILLCPIL